MAPPKQPAQVVGPLRIMHTEPADEQRSPQIDLAGHLRLVAATRIDPPPAWQAIKSRLDELSAAVGARPLLQRLSDAVISGGGDIPALLAAASTELLEHRAATLEIVHAEVLGALRAAYQPVAHKNYTMLAGRFDAAAKRLTKLAAVVDVDAGADAVIADAKRRESWNEAPTAASELDELVPRLAAAALLMRRIEQPWKLGNDEATLHIPLTLDVEHCHPRQVWLAWHQQIETQPTTGDPVMMLAHLTRPPVEHVAHRTGRWGSLLKCSAVIAAHPNPVALELFTPPANRILVHSDPSSGRKTTPRVIDPCDQPNTPGRLRRLVGALSGRRSASGEEPDILKTVAD